MKARKVMLRHPDQPYVLIDMPSGRIGMTAEDAAELVEVLQAALRQEPETKTGGTGDAL